MGTSPSRKAGKLRTLVKNIPAELRKLPQWVCAASDGAPVNPRTGTYAKSNDPSTWGTIEQAAEACEKYGHSYVALALTSSDPYAIVDLDNWAVEGARLFHENNRRLTLPKVVADATKEYRTESDVLGEFLSDECEQGKLHTVAASILYTRYVEWCAENGERSMSKKALGLRLQGDGYRPAKDRRGNRSWQGLRLRGAGNIKGQA